MSRLKFVQFIPLYPLVQTLELLFDDSEKDIVLISGQEGLYDVPGHEQFVKQLGLELELILKVTTILVLMFFLFPEKLLFELIEKQPTFSDHHLTVLNPQNKRKYLHVLREVYVRKVRFQDCRQIGELEPYILFEVLVNNIALAIVFCTASAEMQESLLDLL